MDPSKSSAAIPLSGATPAAPAGKARAGDRFLCVHCHFYQPPRENPWLDAIDEQPTAAPFHDWNERITAECYGPNTAARIVNSAGEILDIRNNYEKISFNIGPTLLAWLEEHQPGVYREILTADARSVLARRGHGNALAQVYNHVIMPLANRRDKNTQVLWGMEDFRSRFRRDPEGMWLAETAVDLETLEVLADNGIRFTILAPRQARAFRMLDGTGSWRSAEHGSIDPSRAYVCTLPSKRNITLFFYDGPISQAVAFEGLLNNGDRFAARLMSGYNNARLWPQLVHIATDGESYGHHHRHGEMALAFALHVIESTRAAALTNYGEYLDLVTPTAEVEIWNNSSWSCVHGVERWRSDCGCNSGMNPGFHQRWRAPLRRAFDHLRDAADAVFDEEGARLLKDPWHARDRYIELMLDPTPDHTRAFLDQHAANPADTMGGRDALRLLEAQRHAQYIYTSCAWFFDEISGIEGQQVLRYAARLIQLLKAQRPDLEGSFLRLLHDAPSNIALFGNGERLWDMVIKPQVVDLRRVIADWALLHFDAECEGTHRHYRFEVIESEPRLGAYGDVRIKLAQVTAIAPFAGRRIDGTVVVLHLGGPDFQCRIVNQLDSADFATICDEVLNTFDRRSLADVVRTIDRHFAGRDYTLADLFPKDQRALLARVTSSSVRRFDSTLVMMYEDSRKLVGYLQEIGAPLPAGFLAVAEYVLRARLKDALEALQSGDFLDAAALEYARDARRFGVRIVDEGLKGRLATKVDQAFRDVALMPTPEACRGAGLLLDLLDATGANLDLWEAQNITFALITGRSLPAHLASQSRYARRPNTPVSPALLELARRLRISPSAPAVVASLQQAGATAPGSTRSRS